MAKEIQFSQLEGNLVTEAFHPDNSDDRILRRATLEILPFTQEWASRKLPMVQKTIADTIRKKENYEHVDKEHWKQLLEEFTGKEIEIIKLRNPFDVSDILHITEKNILKKRFLEIGKKHADTFLLFVWHNGHGLLAAACPSPDTETKYFPNIKTKIEVQFPELDKNETLHLWAWDRKNFTNLCQ
jgi:hypothetical protein